VQTLHRTARMLSVQAFCECVHMPCLPLYVSFSVNTRVGNELGAGNAAAARLSVHTCAAIVALVHSFITVACRCVL
jgi:hypothetical protein